MIARYDPVADSYENGFSDPSDPVVVALLTMMGTVHRARILDLACGHGRVTRELARAGATVTGVDLSRALLDKAQSIEDDQPLGIRYLHGDAASVPALGDGDFDAVTCNFGLSDIDDLDGALGTVCRVLRTGGSFAFSILHPCFPGAGAVSGAWAHSGRYYDEGYWLADGTASTLRQQVGANHRTLSSYINALSRHGLLLQEAAEPEPSPEWRSSSPDRRAAARFPVFLVARCIKHGRPEH